MALKFAATTNNRVDCGSAAMLDNLNVGTAVAWFIKSNNGGSLITKGKGDYSTFRIFMSCYGADKLEMDIKRATTDLRVRSTNAIVTKDAWQFGASSWNTGGVAGDQKLYYGNLTTTAAVVASYDIQTVGTGAVTDDSAEAFELGCLGTGTGEAAGDRQLAVAAIWNRQLSEGEIREQQWRPHPTSGCIGFWVPGWGGTTSCADWSGNGNNGTITGATVTSHVQLGPLFGFDLGRAGTYTPLPPAASGFFFISNMVGV